MRLANDSPFWPDKNLEGQKGEPENIFWFNFSKTLLSYFDCLDAGS